MAGQNAATVKIVKELVTKVLGRDEDFSLTVRGGKQRKLSKDTTMVMVPPVEVS